MKKSRQQTQNSQGPSLKVAFDLDGVLLDNPTRSGRGLISFTKKAHLLSRKQLEFYHPHSPLTEGLWRVLHWTSFRVDRAFPQLVKLVKEQRLEAYIVSGRFACLNANTQHWLKKMQAQQVFKGVYINDQDQQPHLFKEKMIKQLQVDYFVEDNWDIARHLASQLKAGPQRILWVSNLLDRQRSFNLKFSSLGQALNFLATKSS